MKLEIRDQKLLLSASASNMPFELKLLKGDAPNLPAPIHVGQSTGLCRFPQTGHIRDGTIRQRGG